MCQMCESVQTVTNTFEETTVDGLDRDGERQVIDLLNRANRAQLTLIVSTLLISDRVSMDEVEKLTASLGMAVALRIIFGL